MSAQGFGTALTPPPMMVREAGGVGSGLLSRLGSDSAWGLQ